MSSDFIHKWLHGATESVVPGQPKPDPIPQSLREEMKSLYAHRQDRANTALKLYRPMELQEEYHRSNATNTILMGGNRGGKSLAAFVEDARAVTGQDPYNKYPKENGTLVIVGQNWPHSALVVHKMLFMPGAFKVIKDLKTGQWRAFQPWTEEDKQRASESRPAPPLIPPRLIKPKTMAYFRKGLRQFQHCELTTGWTINYYSSEGDIPQGFPADLIHIDEDVSDENWINEMQARLSDRKGKFRWSAMPHSENDALSQLDEMAERYVENGVENPDTVVIRLSFADNMHIDDEEKRKRIEFYSAKGEEEVAKRVRGEFATMGRRMYPEFHRAVHGITRDQLPDHQVPEHWCRYMVVDPGHVVCGVLFAAVPPPDDKVWGGCVVFYRELYITECNAEKFGEEVAKAASLEDFREFVIDMHGGQLTDIGSGRTPHELYSESLQKHKIASEKTGHGFTPGCTDKKGRADDTRLLLMINRDGKARLKYLWEEMPNFERNMKKFRKKVVNDKGTRRVTDEPDGKGDVHLAQCCEYIAALRPQYHKPKPRKRIVSGAVAYFREKQKKNKKQDRGVFLGPQSAA